ncbi:S8 family serine peptidase [Marinicella meishanensis]|uniref:S8 family serine peptidase n=1 Tax=Marinicella meishanensis TaxID=2873263 RepID=UPI001CC10CDE|nr:S8 family serine peptidase [Marinicella sp. NBU2979]
MNKIISSALLLLTGQTWAHDDADHWLKILHPSAELRASLQGQGVHYEHFIWINQAQAMARSPGIQGQVIERPFDYQVDQQKLDLSDTERPAGPWFSAHQSSGAGLYLVQFNGPIKQSWLQLLSNQSVTLISPLAPFSWIVWLTDGQLAAVKQLTPVRQINPLLPAFRVPVSHRDLSAQRVPVMAMVYHPQLTQASEQLVKLGAVIEHSNPINRQLSALTFTLAGDQFLAAAQINSVLTVQQVQTDGGPRGEMSQQSIVGNYDGNNQVQTGYETWLSDTGLDGSGITVAVVDGGIHQNHPDLPNVIACVGVSDSCDDDTDSHGTHVAGAIGGTGQANSLNAAGFNRGLGVAPGVQMVEQLYAPMLGTGPGTSGGMVAGGMLAIYKDSQTSGALLSNNSWGPTGTPQGYDIPTMEVDMISRDANPDVAGQQPVLAVWSIMNGNGDRNTGLCQPSSLGSPDEAKNLFAIGSTKLQNSNATQISAIFDVSSNSAHGPACDGRLVPHVVAPGCRTEAPDSSSGYGMKCGTSMASPVVSGSIALFIEQHRLAHGVDPSPALIKAVFSVVADDLAGNDDADGNVMGHAPNRQQGWGRINLDAVINPSSAFWFHDQATVFDDSGQNWRQSLLPINPAEPMRLMLVWTDAPGAGLGGTNPAWVNDLDLLVATDATYLGNQFDANGGSISGGDADAMNNMEAVFLTPSQHRCQAIDVEVLASNIQADALDPHNPGAPQQDFALVCHNCQPDFRPADWLFADGFDCPLD